jgi:hypothetical protein
MAKLGIKGAFDLLYKRQAVGESSFAGKYALLMQGFLISIKDAQDENGVVFFDDKMDSIGEGVNGFDPDVIVADG